MSSKQMIKVHCYFKLSVGVHWQLNWEGFGFKLALPETNITRLTLKSTAFYHKIHVWYFFILYQESAHKKVIENAFFFLLESSFHSWNIQICVIFLLVNISRFKEQVENWKSWCHKMDCINYWLKFWKILKTPLH